jgi:DNA-binding response OmpR family regulator
MSSPVIVVIEDSPTQAQQIAAHLNAFGFEVYIAYDGPEGLQLVDEILPDAVVLDVNLPSMNGFQVCRRMKRDGNLAHIPVIMLTSTDDSDAILQGLDVGATDYIPKDEYAADNLVATLGAIGLIMP